eukprot:265256_1
MNKIYGSSILSLIFLLNISNNFVYRINTGWSWNDHEEVGLSSCYSTQYHYFFAVVQHHVKNPPFTTHIEYIPYKYYSSGLYNKNWFIFGCFSLLLFVVILVYLLYHRNHSILSRDFWSYIYLLFGCIIYMLLFSVYYAPIISMKCVPNFVFTVIATSIVFDGLFCMIW